MYIHITLIITYFISNTFFCFFKVYSYEILASHEKDVSFNCSMVI
jgi:hypothetical protein